ncbi:MAG: hypothetical protein JWN40_787 [Phycisphaerales bacterium]|nr:hypothetical protein [Phycisphaerales bacterium]
MAAKFPPEREANLVSSASNFDVKITASAPTFGLTSAQATSFHATLVAFTTARTVALDPLTRSPANIIAKDIAKASLLAAYRQLAGIVQRFPGTTNFTRSELGLPLRMHPTPIPAPATAPLIEVKSVAGRTARIRLIDAANPTRRGRPPFTNGAAVFSFVGVTPPASLSDWKFEGNTGRTSVNILFPDTVASGAMVWIAAYWFNPRKQAGPGSDPVNAHLPGGSVSAIAA